MSSGLEIAPMASQGQNAVLRIVGRLDARTAPELIASAKTALTSSENLILNLSHVTFLGSSGLGALLVIFQNAQERGGRVRLAAPSPAVQSAIGLFNLDRHLRVDPTEEESVRALGD